MKTCNKCGETKTLDKFYRARSSVDGRRNDCKSCHGVVPTAAGPDKRACSFCETEFSPYRGPNGVRQKYCSRLCQKRNGYENARSERTNVCINCGDTFTHTTNYERMRCYVCRKPAGQRKSPLEKHLWASYRIKLDRYNQMIANGCWACSTHEVLYVDHDHSCCPGSITCGKCVRGILCRPCNMAEGALEGKPERAEALANYMRRLAPYA